MNPWRSVLVAGGIVLPALLGCAKSGAGSDDGSPAPNVQVPLEVENHGWADVVIYLVRGTSNERLGTVGALQTANFELPYQRLGGGGDTHLRADPIGGVRVFNSEDLLVQPGQRVKWTLENDLTRSFLAVY